MELKLYDPKGKETSRGVVVPEVFDTEGSTSDVADRKKNYTHIIYEVTRAYLLNQRSGTASTKTRGEVDGGSKKPWRQKHTGNARAGSIRSPLWRKGGIIFGPKPKKWHIEIPRAKKRLALAAAISEKIKEGALIVVDKFEVAEPKTKLISTLLKNLGINSKEKSVILAEEKINPVLRLASRNIPNLEYKISKDLNAYEVLCASRIIMTRPAFEALAARISVGKENKATAVAPVS